MGDADDSYDFSEVPNFVEKLRQGHDLVMGNRFQGGIKSGAMPALHQYFGNPGLSWLVNFFFARVWETVIAGCEVLPETSMTNWICAAQGWNSLSNLSSRPARLVLASRRFLLFFGRTNAGAHLICVASAMGGEAFASCLCMRPIGFTSYLADYFFLGLALVFWLLPGQRALTSRVILDVHTMVFGVIFTLLGAQILSIGAFAKVFSYAARFDRGTISLQRFLKRITLEAGLLVGSLVFLVGLTGCVSITWKWASSDFGRLYEIRQVLFWSMWLFLGTQIIFSSFFLSMLGISRGTYIGDYEQK